MGELEDDLHRIGAVAKTTGIAVERLRAWERRYGLSPVHRAGKTRYYSQEQVHRLKKIRILIDQGHAISSLANLTDEQLNARQRPQVQNSTSVPRTALIGANLLLLEQSQDQPVRLDICGRWASVEALDREAPNLQSLQLIILQLTVLDAQLVDKYTKIYENQRFIVIYQFTVDDHLTDVISMGIPTFAWPVSWLELEHTAINTNSLPLRAGLNSARHFSDEELIAIATGAADDAPKHLVALINQLNAFADYSNQRLGEETDDMRSQLHESLQAQTSQARAQLELALDSWVDAEQFLTH